MPSSRYREGAPPDYSHRFHAGNVGDVWKHCVLVELLRRAAGPRVAYLETHAGEGAYDLAATGEWTEGIGRLWDAPRTDDVVGRYVALCRRLGSGGARPTRYPGSPAFARAVLGPVATLDLAERDPVACTRLAAQVAGDARVRVTNADGLHDLPARARAAEARADAVVVLVDPPFTEKADWTALPDALAGAARATGRACLVLWYPVKSLTRPNAMLARLERAGVGGAVAELVTTPLEQVRRRLNGSGLVLVRPPAGALGAIAAAAPVVGAACATDPRGWSVRLRAWDAR